MRAGDAGQVAARRVQNPLRLGRRPGGVEEVEHILALHPLRFAPLGLARYDVMPPEVTTVRHGDVLTRAPHDERVLDAGGALQRLVDVDLEAVWFAPPVAAVGGDD